ncbi:glycosyltransferase [Chloroflexia bacterium SDU3-3]|nr:glycosyltransferase [Chloroflexia bacterium SDU3-3]
MNIPLPPRLQKIAVLGNALPRTCGIATYTTDLCAAITAAFPSIEIMQLAMNDRPEGYDYPPQVRFTLDQETLGDYHQAAEHINMAGVDLVLVQHEYGIFGGAAGSHLLALLCDLRVPIVTTLHTILRDPTPQQRKVLIELVRLSDRLVVMSEQGAIFLREIYGVSAEKIDHIPHGIPDIPFLDSSFNKDHLQAEGKTVMLTFGLLSRNKGIEYVIEAIPDILRQHPNVVYIVLGLTHPHVRQREGEQYRDSLRDLARERGVADHVVFQDQFVNLDELVTYIGAADIYITPYLSEAQIVSGTLAYTLGAGKAIISTPYWYAQEMLADGRGVLVPFRDPGAIATQVNALLADDGERDAMRKRAYLRGREMIWPTVAERYIETLRRARGEHHASTHALQQQTPMVASAQRLPPLHLGHLRHMTDDTGLVQHAVFTAPLYREGYTTDDNARALILTTLIESHPDEPDTEALATRYMAFLWHAFSPETGRFHNFLGYDRRWLDAHGSEDSHARAVWALGTVLGQSRAPTLRGAAAQLFAQALPALLAFEHPRPWAFALLGITAYLTRFRGDRTARQVQTVLAERLLDRYQEQYREEWPWYGDTLTYDNAVLPHALLISGVSLERADMRASGLESLRWLASVQHAEDGHFTPIGCHGFYPSGAAPARFDQQPIEAHAMVMASLAAYQITADEYWHDTACRAFEWFLGHNDLGLPLYDERTGGCHDGLECDRVNQNQGAESTLAFLLALTEMRLDAAHHDGMRPTMPTAIPVPVFRAPTPKPDGRKSR